MTSSRVKTTICILALLALVIGFHFQMEIRQRYPQFDPTMMATGVFFLAGMIYAVIERNIVIAFITIAVTSAIPFLNQCIVAYWPY